MKSSKRLPSGVDARLCERADEIGTLALATNAMATSLRGLLGDISQSVVALSGASSKLTEVSGWTEGLQHMVVGDRTRFWIPGELAYGNGSSRAGAPTGMLVFDVELLAILASD